MAPVLVDTPPATPRLEEEEEEEDTEEGAPRPARRRVQLAVSTVGGVPGARAWHSSVLLDGTEFCFGAVLGMACAKGPVSHANAEGGPEVFELGFSERTPEALKETLGLFFRRGTYDLLRKNCNTFSDCAIYFLLGQRLDPRYRALDQLGAFVPGVVQGVSFGSYRPNLAADRFDAEAVVRSLGSGKNPGALLTSPSSHARAPQDSAGQLLEAMWRGCSKPRTGSATPRRGLRHASRRPSHTTLSL